MGGRRKTSISLVKMKLTIFEPTMVHLYCSQVVVIHSRSRKDQVTIPFNLTGLGLYSLTLRSKSPKMKYNNSRANPWYKRGIQ